MIRVIGSLLIVLILFGCQTSSLPKGAIEISKKVRETSGLATIGNDFLTFNDSGGKPTLYQISPQGKRVAKFKIKGAINRDWEDIAQDDEH